MTNPFPSMVKPWSDIREHPDVVSLYAADTETVDVLPYSVRDALGDLLSNASLDETNAAQRGTFLDEIAQHLKTQGDTAIAEYDHFTKLGTHGTDGKKKKHTKKSLYDVIKRLVERERELTETADVMDVDDTAVPDEQSISAAEPEPEPEVESEVAESMSYEQTDPPLDPALAAFPPSTHNLLAILESS